MNDKAEDTTREEDHGHDFDGIEELDNDLPRWWLGIFAVTTLFALFYWPYYHIFNPDKLPAAKLEAEMAAAAEVRAEAEADKPELTIEDEEARLMERFKNGTDWQASAKADYDIYCMPCHLPDGGGSIGPNMTDDYYIHGGKITDMRHIITEGVPAKGMISWKTQFKPEQIENLALYMRSLRGKTSATPKAPEGKLVDEAGAFIE